jgi:hypothetical protein
MTKAVAGVAVLAALAFGATAIGKSSDSSSASTGTTAAQGIPSRQAPNGAPSGMRGFGTPVTGATLTRLKAVATAKYPGTVERAMKLPDGSYAVHVIASNGQELHVLVSKDFVVTGTQQGPPATSSSSS